MELHNTYKNLLPKVNDLTISFNDFDERGLPVIFLHGYPFDKSMWKGQLDTLKSLKSAFK